MFIMAFMILADDAGLKRATSCTHVQAHTLNAREARVLLAHTGVAPTGDQERLQEHVVFKLKHER